MNGHRHETCSCIHFPLRALTSILDRQNSVSGERLYVATLAKRLELLKAQLPADELEHVRPCGSVEMPSMPCGMGLASSCRDGLPRDELIH